MQADAQQRIVLRAGAQWQAEALHQYAVPRLQAHPHTLDRACDLGDSTDAIKLRPLALNQGLLHCLPVPCIGCVGVARKGHCIGITAAGVVVDQFEKATKLLDGGSVQLFSHFRSSVLLRKVVGLGLFCFRFPWGPGAKRSGDGHDIGQPVHLQVAFGSSLSPGNMRERYLNLILCVGAQRCTLEG